MGKAFWGTNGFLCKPFLSAGFSTNPREDFINMKNRTHQKESKGSFKPVQIRNVLGGHVPNNFSARETLSFAGTFLAQSPLCHLLRASARSHGVHLRYQCLLKHVGRWLANQTENNKFAFNILVAPQMTVASCLMRQHVFSPNIFWPAFHGCIRLAIPGLFCLGFHDCIELASVDASGFSQGAK